MANWFTSSFWPRFLRVIFTSIAIFTFFKRKSILLELPA